MPARGNRRNSLLWEFLVPCAAPDWQRLQFLCIVSHMGPIKFESHRIIKSTTSGWPWKTGYWTIYATLLVQMPVQTPVLDRLLLIAWPELPLSHKNGLILACLARWPLPGRRCQASARSQSCVSEDAFQWRFWSTPVDLQTLQDIHCSFHYCREDYAKFLWPFWCSASGWALATVSTST